MTDITAIFEPIAGAGAVVPAATLKDRAPGYCAQSREAACLLRPETTEELSRFMVLAHEHRIGVIPQGGLSGLVDATGAQPDEVAVSLERMAGILRIDPAQAIVEVEAGATLEQIDAALAPHGLMLGVDIPSRGQCTVGGIISTNAGGIRVLRYGMTRENVLGLEVVLPDGTILSDMNTLLKNNTGYDLKQLFIGAEGTLGIVTRAVLKTVPRPRALACALLSCPDLEAAQRALVVARRIAGGHLLSFEAMWPEYYALTAGGPGMPATPPLPKDAGLYLILEVEAGDAEAAEALLMTVFEATAEEAGVEDGVVAKSEAERKVIWRLREDSDMIGKIMGGTLSYDVSIEAAQMKTFVDRWQDICATRFADLPCFVFGHLGDGNLHVVMAVTPERKTARADVDDALYSLVSDIAGSSVSAEHGIGTSKRSAFRQSVPEGRRSMMRRIKQMIDPAGIMNPRVLFD